MLMLTEFVRVEVAAMLLEMVCWFDVMLVMLLLIVRIEDVKLVFVVEMPEELELMANASEFRLEN